MDFSFESKGVEIVEIVNDMMIVFLFFFLILRLINFSFENLISRMIFWSC